MPPADAPVDILWTGGWDSTFRVLDLAMRLRVPLQPWYLRDPERASTPVEEATMEAVRAALARRDPEAAAHILPVRAVAVGDVQPDEEVTARYRKTGLGSQYDWLARFARQWDIPHLELGIVKGGPIHKRLEPDLVRVPKAGGHVWRIREDPADPVHRLFEQFDLPLLTHTKVEMREEAAREGFLDLMQLTWFCHSPKGGRPCGVCTPCRIGIETGMAWRIPRHRQLRHRLSMVKRRVLPRKRTKSG